MTNRKKGNIDGFSEKIPCYEIINSMCSACYFVSHWKTQFCRMQTRVNVWPYEVWLQMFEIHHSQRKTTNLYRKCFWSLDKKRNQISIEKLAKLLQIESFVNGVTGASPVQILPLNFVSDTRKTKNSIIVIIIGVLKQSVKRKIYRAAWCLDLWCIRVSQFYHFWCFYNESGYLGKCFLCFSCVR